MDAHSLSADAAVSPALSPLIQGLEEVCAATPRDMAAALAFALARGEDAGGRADVLVASRDWLREQGRPYGQGLAGLRRGRRLLLVATRTPAEGLWAMEQALRSGGADIVLGALEGADLAQTRRLEFAARDGGSAGVLLRTRTGDLSAARRRWRIATLTSFPDRDDPRAPGRLTLRAELTRSRGERPGAWMLEQDDETHRLRLADRLAGDGLGPIGRTRVA